MNDRASVDGGEAGNPAGPFDNDANGLVRMIGAATYLVDESHWDKAGPFYDDDPVTGEGATHTHVWAADYGRYVYAFAWPDAEVESVELTARLSSEHPWYSSPINHFSDVTLSVNDCAYPFIRVIPDNGSGQVYRWAIDPRQLHAGINHLSFEVARSAVYRNGLCIYDRAVKPGQQSCPIRITGLR